MYDSYEKLLLRFDFLYKMLYLGVKAELFHA